jgi:hypothetical protein
MTRVSQFPISLSSEHPVYTPLWGVALLIKLREDFTFIKRVGESDILNSHSEESGSNLY